MAKWDVHGKMSVRGKVVKMVFDEESPHPMRFFCFLRDVERLLASRDGEVRIFLDRPGNADVQESC
jgi:hypothetical protein